MSSRRRVHLVRDQRRAHCGELRTSSGPLVAFRPQFAAVYGRSPAAVCDVCLRAFFRTRPFRYH